jgi:uncharacterized protein (DUF2147 family)
VSISIRMVSVALLWAGASVSTGAWAADDKLAQAAGNWLTEPKDGIIQISVGANGQIEGRIVGGNHPGLTDVHNPDPARRNQVLRGQVILRDMKYDGAGRWSGGTVYDPKKGKLYKCLVELLGPGTLKVRGYIGIPLLGVSEKWTRYTGTSMDLPPAP